jgi:hypothetical protein
MAKSSPARQGLQSPKLDTSWLAVYYLTHLEAQTHDLNECYRIFALVNLTLENFRGTIDQDHVDQQERRLVQPLQTPARARTWGLRFDQEGNDKPDDHEDSPQEEQWATSLAAWEHIPETHSWDASDELGRLLYPRREIRVGQTCCWTSCQPGENYSFSMYGLEDNANNLIVMHREVLSCWLLLADDLKLLSDNQSLLQSQMEAQATLAREEEDLLGAEVQALA